MFVLEVLGLFVGIFIKVYSLSNFRMVKVIKACI